MKKVLFYVQHLLGIGHLARASAIAQAAIAEGLELTMVTGGMPVDGFPGPDVPAVQLPPLRAGDGGFSDLVSADGQRVDAAWKQARCTELLQVFGRLKPDIVLIEAFPFGRRQMRFELHPLLDVAGKLKDCKIVCSVRDILQARSPERDAETVRTVRQHFAAVLVHGDPLMVRLDETFPLASEIADLVHYTGIVSAPPGELQGPPADIVVSAGGGVAGLKLLETACRTAGLMDGERTWCLIAGPNLPEAEFQKLGRLVPSGARLERHRKDFRALLHHAGLSVSQAGYNTVADVLRAGCRSVLVPFADDGESEQTCRARLLAGPGRVSVLQQDGLTAQRLAQEIEQRFALPVPGPMRKVKLDGATQTARLLSAL